MQIKNIFDTVKEKFKSTKSPGQKRDSERFWSFWILAIVPLLTPDIILRYFTDGIKYSLGYHILASAFTLCWIVLVAFICIVLLGKKAGRIVYMVVGIISTVWFFANYVYFDVTGSYLMLDSIGMLGEATGYLGVVGSHLNASIIIGFLLCVTCLVLACILWPQKKYPLKKKVAMCIIPIIGLVLVRVGLWGVTIYDNAHKTADPWDKLSYEYKNTKDTPKIMNMTGFYQYTIRSILDNVTTNASYDEDEIEEVREYFDSKTIQPNIKTGLLAGKNVIFVMMESMDDWLINPKYTPTISMMMENGINFSQNYSPTRGTGFTFSTEFCLNSGFYCPTGRASATVFNDKPFIRSMASAFNKAGYVSRSFHYNTGTFYNRADMHRQFGYKSYNSFLDYMVYKDAILDSVAISNDDLFNALINPNAESKSGDFTTSTDTIQDPAKILPDAGYQSTAQKLVPNDGANIPNDEIDSDKPFFDYVITYSAHLPYKDDDFKAKLIKQKYPSYFDVTLNPVVSYAQMFAHDTDEFFRILLEKLEASGELDNTVIVAFSDHYTYGIKDKSIMTSVSRVAGSTIYEKTPFFIYAPWLKHESVTKVSSTCDVLPTIANLFGLEKTKYTIGSDVYDDNNEGFMFFANNSWYDGLTFYNSKKANDDEVEFDTQSQERIFQNCEKAVRLNRINDFCVESGLYSMSEDEITTLLNSVNSTAKPIATATK